MRLWWKLGTVECVEGQALQALYITEGATGVYFPQHNRLDLDLDSSPERGSS